MRNVEISAKISSNKTFLSRVDELKLNSNLMRPHMSSLIVAELFCPSSSSFVTQSGLTYWYLKKNDFSFLSTC